MAVYSPYCGGSPASARQRPGAAQQCPRPASRSARSDLPWCTGPNNRAARVLNAASVMQPVRTIACGMAEVQPWKVAGFSRHRQRCRDSAFSSAPGLRGLAGKAVPLTGVAEMGCCPASGTCAHRGWPLACARVSLAADAALAGGFALAFLGRARAFLTAGGAAAGAAFEAS
jgi:hypothetical protein